jgi:hypothetical protein
MAASSFVIFFDVNRIALARDMLLAANLIATTAHHLRAISGALSLRESIFKRC